MPLPNSSPMTQPDARNLPKIPAELLLEVADLLPQSAKLLLINSGHRWLSATCLPSLYRDVQLYTSRNIMGFCDALAAHPELGGKVRHLHMDCKGDDWVDSIPNHKKASYATRIASLDALETLHIYSCDFEVASHAKFPRLRSFGADFSESLAKFKPFIRALPHIEELIIRTWESPIHLLGKPLAPLHLPSLHHFSGPAVLASVIHPGPHAERWEINWDEPQPHPGSISYYNDQPKKPGFRPNQYECLPHLANSASNVTRLSNTLASWAWLSPMQIAEHLPHLVELRFEKVPIRWGPRPLVPLHPWRGYEFEAFLTLLDEALPRFSGLTTLAVVSSFYRSQWPGVEEAKRDFHYERTLVKRWTALCPSLVDLTFMSGMRCRLLESEWRVVDSAGVPYLGPMSAVFEFAEKRN